MALATSSRSSASSTSADDLADRVGMPEERAARTRSRCCTAGEIVARQAKHHLWNYGVGDEIRNFVPGDTINVVQVRRRRRRDRDLRGPLARRARPRPRRPPTPALLVVPNGSPYEADKDDVRLHLCTQRAREGDCALAYVTSSADRTSWFRRRLVVVAPRARCSAAPGSSSPSCSSSTSTFRPPRRPCRIRTRGSGADDQANRHLRRPGHVVRATRGDSARAAPRLEEIYRALVVGLRDYVGKNGFSSVLMGLSGGIDSTLVGTSPSTRSGPTTSSASPTRANGRASTPAPTPPSSPSAPGCSSTPSRSRRSSTPTRRR